MAIAMYDAVDDLKSMLTTDWNGTGQGGVLPTIREAWIVKAVGLISDTNDEVVLTPLDEFIQYFALYGLNYLHHVPILIDIRTFTDMTRHEQVVKEVARILKANIRRASTGFIDIVAGYSKSYNVDYRNMFRHTIDVTYRKLDPTQP